MTDNVTIDTELVVPQMSRNDKPKEEVTGVILEIKSFRKDPAWVTAEALCQE